MSRPGVVFIGTEEIGWRCLEALLELDARVVGIFTLTEARAKEAVAFRSFRPFLDRSLPVEFVDDINAPEVIERIRSLRPVLAYEIGWSQILSKPLLETPTDGCVGMHCSLLPRHRGRAPVPWSIIFGLRKSGMSLFHLSAGPDDGDLIGQSTFAIQPDDSATEVYAKSVDAAEQLVRIYHPQLEAGTAPRVRQDPRRSDTWPRRTPQDGLIDWDRSAHHLYDWVRALTHPFPGAFTFWRDGKLVVWRAKPGMPADGAEAGAILDIDAERGILVGTGEGTLWLTSVQWHGHDEWPAAEFATREGVRVGECLT
ncbi:MAG: methionyl-tRNA formyltransferase [Vicinamibacterales bacterium]|jgi:methionyl-tRNA formyltransferase|nr:methionyl-tRNA formyltransferase [Vicinamibacterales bacterium]